MDKAYEQIRDELIKGSIDARLVRELMHGMTLLEKRLDAQEQVMARIILAYPEIWATLQALIQTSIAPLEEEDQKAFIALMDEYRNQALNQMNDTIDDMERNPEEAESSNSEPAEEQSDPVSPGIEDDPVRVQPEGPSEG